MVEPTRSNWSTSEARPRGLRFTDYPKIAALALAESINGLGDRTNPVPDPVWHGVAPRSSERELVFLVPGIAKQNLYSRFNVTTRQVAADLDGADGDSR